MNQGEAKHEFSHIETVETIIAWELGQYDSFLKNLSLRKEDKVKLEEYRKELIPRLDKVKDRCHKLFGEMIVYLPPGEYRGKLGDDVNEEV